MAFREGYIAECKKSRAARKPVRWFFSGGHDPRGRESAVRVALEKGRLELADALKLLPDMTPPNRKILEIAADATKRLGPMMITSHDCKPIKEWECDAGCLADPSKPLNYATGASAKLRGDPGAIIRDKLNLQE